MTVERFFEYALLCMLASGYLALAGSGSIAPLAIGLTGAALVARALMVAGIVRVRIPPQVTTGLTLAYMGFYAADYFVISRSFPTATVHLIFFLAVTKILTASTNRDYFYVKAIALLELLAASLFSERSSFLLYLGMFLVSGVAAFASDEIRKSSRTSGARVVAQRAPVGRLALFTGAVSVGILVITAGFFFLLPRTARAALQRFAPGHYRMAGFSSEVDLGTIGELQQRGTPVMHVRTEDGRPMPAGLKWRGAALAAFDGKRWYNPPGLGLTGVVTSQRHGLFVLATGEQQRRAAPRITYVVHLSEMAGDALFFAGRPEFLWIDAPYVERTAPGTFRRQFGPPLEVTYQARSLVEGDDGGTAEDTVTEKALQEGVYLRLPPTDRRVWALARKITAGIEDPLWQARAIERYLPEHYAYTLRLPEREARDPIANFLFVRRKGHCEYFASTMAVMLRTLGIPSRLVTGFQGGVYNPIDHQQLIRASDAHSWVEAWLPDRGWTTFDPTPFAPGTEMASLLDRLELYADAADVFWQEWVLDYSLDHQLLLAARMEDSGRRLRMGWLDHAAAAAGEDWRAMERLGRSYGLPAALAAIALGLALGFGGEAVRWAKEWAQVRRAREGRARPSDAAVLYQRMLRLMERRGVARPVWLTPREFAAVVREPRLAELAREMAEGYNELRFGGRAEGAETMARVLEELEEA